MVVVKHIACIIFALSFLQSISVFLAAGKQNRGTTRGIQSTLDVKDKIIELQCYAKCFTAANSIHSNDCEPKCRFDLTKSPRPGKCPNTFVLQQQQHTTVQQHKLSCIDSCHFDYDCPEVQKCCAYTCGPVCQEPIGVRDDVTLPPIPNILNFKLPKGHKVEITMQASASSIYVYHVEARYHVGNLFSPRKLGPWQWQPVEKIAEISENKTKRIKVSFNLKPGRWYQFRVAAINARGFRGYSEPSKGFTLSNHPKPPKAPADLQVVAIKPSTFGKLYTAKIMWCPAKSSLPVEKYKIIWALYIKSEDDSLIVNEAFVREVHQFDITGLYPDSSYYIQVQAISISGNRRLKSEKISILYNTTFAAAQAISDGSIKLKCNAVLYRKQFSMLSTSPAAANLQPKIRNSETNSIQEANSTQFIGNISNISTSSLLLSPPLPVAATSDSFNIQFRPSRKFGMIVQISGFHPHKGRVIEICASHSNNCENREYNAIRAKKDCIEFGKLKFNTSYIIKTIRTNENGDVNDFKSENQIKSMNFTTPKCENWRKRFPKMMIEC